MIIHRFCLYYSLMGFYCIYIYMDCIIWFTSYLECWSVPRVHWSPCRQMGFFHQPNEPWCKPCTVPIFPLPEKRSRLMSVKMTNNHHVEFLVLKLIHCTVFTHPGNVGDSLHSVGVVDSQFQLIVVWNKVWSVPRHVNDGYIPCSVSWRRNETLDRWWCCDKVFFHRDN